MVMTQVNVHEAKTHLSRLLDQALAGEEIVIMRSGKPLVRLAPVETAPSRRMLGTAKGEFTVPDDFDELLPDEILAGFEGRAD
jgi:prevent-host-death family protein